MNIRAFSLLTLSLTLAGCAATGPVVPMRSADEVSSLDDEQERLWGRAKEFDESLVNSEKLYTDDRLESYLQSVMDRLFPQMQGAIRIRAINSPDLNAFALPNGSIYVNIGLLARMENEAQLAAVLAHEGGHFINRHGVQQNRSIKGAAVFAMGTAMLGIPLAGDLVAVSSIYGFSRELERDADRVSFERMRTAGYDYREAIRVFEHLAAEAKAMDRKEPVFFASHPQLQERIENFKAFSEEAGTPAAGRPIDNYLERTRRARVVSIDEDCAQGRHQNLMLLMESPVAERSLHKHERLFYLGEAHRLRNGEGDLQKAVEAYGAAVKADAKYAPPRRALGLHYLKTGEAGPARANLKAYIALAGNANDVDYMKQYLAQIERGEK